MARAAASAGRLAAHVVHERAAAAGALGDHHLDPVAGQEADRRLVDVRRQHLLRATGQQRDAPAPFALRGEHLGPIDRG